MFCAFLEVCVLRKLLFKLVYVVKLAPPCLLRKLNKATVLNIFNNKKNIAVIGGGLFATPTCCKTSKK